MSIDPAYRNQHTTIDTIQAKASSAFCCDCGVAIRYNARRCYTCAHATSAKRTRAASLARSQKRRDELRKMKAKEAAEILGVPYDDFSERLYQVVVFIEGRS